MVLETLSLLCAAAGGAAYVKAVLELDIVAICRIWQSNLIESKFITLTFGWQLSPVQSCHQGSSAASASIQAAGVGNRTKHQRGMQF